MPDVWDRLDGEITLAPRSAALVLLRTARELLEADDATAATAVARRAAALLPESDAWSWAPGFIEGVALATLGDHARSIPLLRSARAALAARHEEALCAKTLWWLSGALIESGALDEARGILVELIPAQSKADDVKGAAWSGIRLSELLARTGDTDGARAVLSAACEAFAACGDANGEALARARLASLETPSAD